MSNVGKIKLKSTILCVIFVCVLYVFMYLCICICLQWWCVLCGGGKQDQDGGRPNMDALLAAQLSPVNDDSRGKRW